MEVFFLNLPSTPQDGDNLFLKAKQTAEIILFYLLLNDSLLQKMHNRCSLFFLQLFPFRSIPFNEISDLSFLKKTV